MIQLLTSLVTMQLGLIGGSTALPYELKSTIFIDRSCTATKIAPYYFLTAGHCIVDEDRNVRPMYRHLNTFFYIRSHATNVRRINIVKYFIHNEFNDSQGKNAGFDSYDLAIIKVDSETNEIPVAKLNFDYVRDQEEVVIGGYGCENPMREIRGHERKYKIATTQVIKTVNDYYNFMTLGDTGFLCSGDSGGGVFRADTFELIGVNALTFRRQSDNQKINGHARISEVKNWILNIIESN